MSKRSITLTHHDVASRREEFLIQRLAECSEQIEQLRSALRQLHDEVLAAGYATATDYNWPKAVDDARLALAMDKIKRADAGR
jgi:hypothetical protein